ncbi:MAG TPA: protease inhibitor I42 family protein [Halanaerobiales bacterium]|nr:protease inhibitor I42 family protein [Halanaerobiales bacterium]
MNKKLIYLMVVILFLPLLFSNSVNSTDIKEKTLINGNFTTITINKKMQNNQKWQYKIADQNIVEIVSESYTKQVKTDDENVINDIHTWYVEAISTGNTVIEFDIVDSSGQVIGDESIKYKITILPKTIAVKSGNLIKIELKENRSTGYTWHLDIENNNIIIVHHDNYIEPQTEPLKAGQSGIHYWYIKGVNKGKTALTFKLYRDWEQEQIAEIKKYIIEVD